MPVTISSLTIYPVKSCRGVTTDAAAVTPTGFFLDRQWVVVHEETGNFMTQREMGKMALVQPELPAGALLGQAGGCMRVTAQGVASVLEVPLQVPAAADSSLLRTVTVWDWTGQGLDEGDAAAAFFTAFLGVRCRLVRYLGNVQHSMQQAGPGPLLRSANPAFAPEWHVAFADQFPLLVATEADLADLNQRLAADPEAAASMAGLLPLPMARFRPNIVLSGTEAWEQDKWGALAVHTADNGTLELVCKKPCSRCKLITVNPMDGTKSAGEPYDILTTFRSGATLGFNLKSFKHMVFFGWQMVPPRDISAVVLRVGDAAAFQGEQTAY